MSICSDLPKPLLDLMAKASADLRITEQEFAVIAVAEKLARHEHRVWVETLSIKEDSQTSCSPSPTSPKKRGSD